MRERFRHSQGEGIDLVITELPGPRGSIWALIEDSRGSGHPATAILSQHDAADDVIDACARRLSQCYGGQIDTWQAVVRESLQPSY